MSSTSTTTASTTFVDPFGITDVLDDALAAARQAYDRAEEARAAQEVEVARLEADLAAKKLAFGDDPSAATKRAKATAAAELDDARDVYAGCERKVTAAQTALAPLNRLRASADKARAARRAQDFNAAIQPEVDELVQLREQLEAIDARLRQKLGAQHRDAEHAGLARVRVLDLYDQIREVHRNRRLDPATVRGVAPLDHVHLLLSANDFLGPSGLD